MPEQLDNPLRYQNVPPRMGADEGRPPVPALGNLPRPLDALAIMHVLEQIKAEMRTLVSEVSLMAQEIANIRRQLTPQKPGRF